MDKKSSVGPLLSHQLVDGVDKLDSSLFGQFWHQMSKSDLFKRLHKVGPTNSKHSMNEKFAINCKKTKNQNFIPGYLLGRPLVRVHPPRPICIWAHLLGDGNPFSSLDRKNNRKMILIFDFGSST